MFTAFNVKSKTNTTTEDERNKALIVSRQLNKIILESLDFEDVVQKIADAIPNELAFATSVVAVIDEKKGTIRRVAASRTKEAIEAIKALDVPFKLIEIPLNDQENYMAKAVRDHQILITTDSYDVLGPVLNREQSRKIQDIMGTKTTFVCPIYGSKNRAIGVFIASTSKTQQELTRYEREMIQIFIDGVGIAIEHALLYSRLKDASEQLASANVKLKSLDKLKDDFVSVASHELRTPMTAIKSYIWMALNKYGALPFKSSDTKTITSKQKLPEDLQKYMSRAYISVERLINLVNDMLNISRIESGRIALRLAETDLVQLAQETIDEVKAKAAEKNITLKLNTHIYSKVLCDRDKIHEVYLNLLGNSLKFTPNNGLVTVNFQEKAPFVYVSITDTGVGIHKDDGRLFTKFGRLDNSYVASASSGGTGLGLFISKSLVEIHKGSIIATSEGENKGSTFTFSLPIVATELANKLKAEAPQETADSK